jgi:hypothetical protein
MMVNGVKLQQIFFQEINPKFLAIFDRKIDVNLEISY